MAKKDKIVDLKPKSITEDELKSIQEAVGPINQAQMEIGRMETRKHMMNHEVSLLQEKLQALQKDLEDTYGKVNINIQNGEINYDVEADS